MRKTAWVGDVKPETQSARIWNVKEELGGEEFQWFAMFKTMCFQEWFLTCCPHTLETVLLRVSFL